MAQSGVAESCFGCKYFSNSPEFMERTYPGIKTMSSGYASVRKDDGICSLHDLYLSASAYCEQYSSDIKANRQNDPVAP
ncbi:MAG: hypothetical protein WCA64_02640 [Gallionella sp.]